MIFVVVVVVVLVVLLPLLSVSSLEAAERNKWPLQVLTNNRSHFANFFRFNSIPRACLAQFYLLLLLWGLSSALAAVVFVVLVVVVVVVVSLFWIQASVFLASVGSARNYIGEAKRATTTTTRMAK